MHLRDSADITSAMQLHADSVLRACTVYFRNRPEREDAFQETFLKYAQSTAEFADEEHRKAWLIRVAVNACKDMLKKAEAANASLDAMGELPFPDETADASPGGVAYELQDALQRLDEKYRIVLYMKYYEGYTAAEIARMLDMPENTVYTDLARGRERLKEVLSDVGRP